MSSLSKIKYISLISGIAALVLGIYVIMRPTAIIEGMGVLFCIVLLVEGISEIFAFIADRSDSKSIWRLFEGVVSIITAVYFIEGDILSFSLGMVSVFGIWLIVISITKLLMSLRLSKYEKNIGQRLIVAAIVELLLGLFISIKPAFVGGFLSVFIALALFAQAVTAIFRFFRLNRLERKMK